MEIKNFIKIYDEVLPWKVLSNLIRFANISTFQEAKIGGNKEVIEGKEEKGVKNFNIRRTYTLPLSKINNSMSNVHWNNLLESYFVKGLIRYQSDANILDYHYGRVFDIEILKYENTGFYTWHVDHFSDIPRTMSCILLLNNDYEGGNICFRNPDGSDESEIEVKPNRMIIWPSNFLYPHTVKPVTKGKRYSVVAWSL
jgi:predicted 2-oxoglutarate/Fe(II)-dependent dioxygenase YbiX